MVHVELALPCPRRMLACIASLFVILSVAALVGASMIESDTQNYTLGVLLSCIGLIWFLAC